MKENVSAECIEKKEKEVFQNKKKKIVLIVAIVLSAVLLVTASFLIVSMLKKSADNAELPNDISGAWELVENPELTASSDDEAEKENAYYVFDAPDKYGRGSYYTCYQGGVEYFEYELLEEESVEKINLGTENLEYKITGSKSKGDATLTVIYPEHTDEMTGLKQEAMEYVFAQAETPDYEKQSFEDFTLDNSLIGTWVNNERTLSYYQYTYTYEQCVEYKDNGIMIIRYKSDDLLLDRYMYYAYTVEDSEFTFSSVTDKETKYSVSYGLDESGNLYFIDDTTSGSIFADAFFGNFTFYASDNIPEVTVLFTD
ncbi:MAG: hypothetical protein E7566_07835 [Ruminococcaceae bacterium]|nr:hypothetical protein [Oscillospiraceae bacterium]